MLTRLFILLNVILYALSAHAEVSFNHKLPQSISEYAQWCKGYHAHFIDQCYRHDGNDRICVDAALRKMVAQMGGAKSACQRNPGRGMTPDQCTTFYNAYLNNCPIVASIHPVDQPSYKRYSLNTHTAYTKSNQQIQPLNRHVLLIGLDGTRADAFQLAHRQLKQEGHLQNVTQFIEHNGINLNYYAGGQQHKSSQQATLSEPGWASILTGVWANQHHIRNNTDIEEGKYNRAIPTIYNRIKEEFPLSLTASYSDWRPIGLLAAFKYRQHDDADINQLYLPKSYASIKLAEQRMTQQIVRLIKSNNPPIFTYVHYNNPDETGHVYGFNPKVNEYVDAIKQELANINELLKAIEHNKNQHWLVIITTDHGGHNKIHGTQKNEDRSIFAIIGPAGVWHEKMPEQKGQTVFSQLILQYLNS